MIKKLLQRFNQHLLISSMILIMIYYYYYVLGGNVFFKCQILTMFDINFPEEMGWLLESCTCIYLTW